MNKRNLPLAAAAQPCAGLSFDLPQSAMARWNPALMAADKKDGGPETISVLDPIGYDPWTGEGVTAKRIGGVLRALGGKDVVVNINSPGGDVFEGLAIYNQLREYPGHVTGKVLGVAASAASIIAMGVDTLEIGASSFLMIHNAWMVVAGNRNDMKAAADMIEPFDRAMAEIYAARSGLDAKKIAKLMDAESWFSGQDAIANGLADALLPADQITHKDGTAAPAARALDVALAKAGMPRSERRRLLNEIKGTPGAAHDGTPCAAESASLAASTVDFMAALASMSSAASHFKNRK